jgi:hypothetical protein
MSKSGRERAQERIARIRAEEARRRRRRLWLAAAGAAVVVIAAAVGITLAVTGGSSGNGLPLAALSTLGNLQPAPAPGAAGPEGVPIPRPPRWPGRPRQSPARRWTGSAARPPSRRCSTSTRI